MSRTLIQPRWQGAAAVLLLVALLLPPARQALEASMWRHMMVQFPLLLITGALLAGTLPARARRALAGWNVYGAAGLVFATSALALLMIPRILDLALLQPRVEAAKLATLVLAGAALRVSWRPAGIVVQFFFLGNAVSMMAIAGMLYMDSPLRLCNAYLLDDQERLGEWLVGAAIVIGLAWLAQATRVLMRREADAIEASEQRRASGTTGSR